MDENESIIAKTHDFLKYVIPQLEKFPRNQKFLLADRIENHILDILEIFIQAYYSPKAAKANLLHRANLKLETLRHLTRLCHEMRYINMHKYEVMARSINEIGAMTGGWLKSL